MQLSNHDYTPIRSVIVKVGDVKDGVCFTEPYLRLMAKHNPLLHYNAEENQLEWIGLVYGEKQT